MTLQVLVVRHGETSWNARGTVIGQADPPLDDIGLGQAELLAAHLRDVPLGEIWSSDLRRALQTADIIARPHGLLVRPTSALREASFGSLEGRSIEDLTRSGEWRERERDKYGFVPPRGESYFAVEDRVEAFLKDLVERARGRLVLLVTHVGVVRVLSRLIGGLTPTDAGNVSAPHLGIWRLRYEDGQCRTMTFTECRPL